VALLLEQEGQLAQVLGVAQRMPTGQLAVGPPPVMNERADTGAQQTDGVERLFASLRVNPDPGQPPRGEDVPPVECAGHSQSGLVQHGVSARMHDRTLPTKAADWRCGCSAPDAPGVRPPLPSAPRRVGTMTGSGHLSPQRSVGRDQAVSSCLPLSYDSATFAPGGEGLLRGA